ncbi:MAG TPA: hypothetical protein VG754_13440 [Verrucomicrobiae bacterium]|jgi:hypothetical protein|nr:hypothetical protein [Verrucomicrobiae bacterium]
MRCKTWILALACLAGICIAVDRVFTEIIIFRDPSQDGARIKHLCEDNSEDIPIFGPSKAHGNYSPNDMGIKAYNYGFNGASYEVVDTFLQIELAKPRTTPIIIELQHRDTGILGEKSQFIPFASDPRFQPLLKKFNAMSWRYHFPGIRYFGYYDFILSTYLSGCFHVSKMSQGFGELVRTPPFNRAQLDQYIRERLAYQNGYYPDEDQNRRFIAHIKGHPQRLFFLVVSPYHPSYYANFENEDKFEAYKKELAAIPNVVVIDWGKLDYPDEYFLDTLHLRRGAAAIFSRQLGNKIREVLEKRKQQPPNTAAN